MSSLCLLIGIWSVPRKGQNRDLIHILRHWIIPGTQSLGFFPEDAKGDTILDSIGDPSHQTNLFPHIKQQITIDMPVGVYA
jgi:hypothetical protein